MFELSQLLRDIQRVTIDLEGRTKRTNVSTLKKRAVILGTLNRGETGAALAAQVLSRQIHGISHQGKFGEDRSIHEDARRARVELKSR